MGVIGNFRKKFLDISCPKHGNITVYPKKDAHGFCFAVLCCGYTLTDFPISIRLTSLALWQSNDCLSASKATLMNMDKYFMWIHYERLHNHNKAKHNKTVCIFLGIYCTFGTSGTLALPLYIFVKSRTRTIRCLNDRIPLKLDRRRCSTAAFQFQERLHKHQSKSRGFDLRVKNLIV